MQRPSFFSAPPGLLGQPFGAALLGGSDRARRRRLSPSRRAGSARMRRRPSSRAPSRRRPRSEGEAPDRQPDLQARRPGVVFIRVRGRSRRPILPSASRSAAGRGDRLGLRDRQGRPHPHQRPRRRGREQDRGRLRREQDASRAKLRRQGHEQRRRAAEGERRQGHAEAAHARRLSKREVGDPVVAIGNPFGLDRTRHDRHRERAPAPAEGAERLHDQQRDPDRRCDQPRQLRRPAARQPAAA